MFSILKIVLTEHLSVSCKISQTYQRTIMTLLLKSRQFQSLVSFHFCLLMIASYCFLMSGMSFSVEEAHQLAALKELTASNLENLLNLDLNLNTCQLHGIHHTICRNVLLLLM